MVHGHATFDPMIFLPINDLEVILAKAMAWVMLSWFVISCTSINEIKSNKTYTTKIQREGTVNVESRATGITSNRVGTATILSIPVGRIKAEGDTSASLMKSVGQALSAAGYNSKAAEGFRSADAAYLKAHVEDIRFGNFLFWSWGTIIVHLRLETRDNDLLWKTRIRTSVSVVNSYERTAVITMNRLVKAMADRFAQADFYVASNRIRRHNEFVEEPTGSQ